MTASHVTPLGHHIALCPHARAAATARLLVQLRQPLRPARRRKLLRLREAPDLRCQHGTRARAQHADIETPPAPVLKFSAALSLSITSSGWLHGPLAAARASWATAYATVLQRPIQAVQKVAQNLTFDGAGPLAVGVAVLLLLLVLVRSLLRLQRQKKKPTEEEFQQLQRRSRELAKQRERMISALNSSDNEQYYQQAQDFSEGLDEGVPTLNTDGEPLGERLVNPLYWDDPDLKRQWGEFLRGSKLSLVEETAWYDASDAQRPSGKDLPKTDGIDWNA